eukprot:2653062-Lingulodinium_polyedra.AAC.1
MPVIARRFSEAQARGVSIARAPRVLGFFVSFRTVCSPRVPRPPQRALSARGRPISLRRRLFRIPLAEYAT